MRLPADLKAMMQVGRLQRLRMEFSGTAIG
jgi:hypothetical protein